MTEILIRQVRRKLNITWEDDETNARVEDIINSAIPAILHMLGIADPDFDLSTSGLENTLFLAYCLYEWNNALNEFEDNYHKEIATVQARHAVKQYLESEETQGEQI